MAKKKKKTRNPEIPPGRTEERTSIFITHHLLTVLEMDDYNKDSKNTEE